MQFSRTYVSQHSLPSQRAPHLRIAAIAVAVVAGLCALMLGTLSTGGAAQAAGAPIAVNQCNGTDNVGGQAVACDVTITNNLDVATGTASSVLTVKECHGAANAALTCTTTTTPSNALITSVTQCNGSGSGGGGTVACTVHIVNTITGAVTPTPATINQCNGSGADGGTQPTVVCTPIGNTTNATIDQCNTSGNGGGGTRRVQCTVTPSTQTSALPITVNQCDGSGNGGGATVTCTVSLTNVIIPAAPSTTPVTTTPVITTPVVTTPVVTTPVVTTPVVTTPVVTTPVVTTPVITRPVITTPLVTTPVGVGATSLIPRNTTSGVVGNVSSTTSGSSGAVVSGSATNSQIARSVAETGLARTGNGMVAPAAIIAALAVMAGALLTAFGTHRRRPRHH